MYFRVLEEVAAVVKNCHAHLLDGETARAARRKVAAESETDRERGTETERDRERGTETRETEGQRQTHDSETAAGRRTCTRYSTM